MRGKMFPKNLPSPRREGMKGRGGPNGLYFVHPHPNPPPCLRRSGFAQAGIEGGGDYWEISNIFG